MSVMTTTEKAGYDTHVAITSGDPHGAVTEGRVRTALAGASAAVNINSQKLSAVATGTAATDGVNVDQVFGTGPLQNYIVFDDFTFAQSTAGAAAIATGTIFDGMWRCGLTGTGAALTAVTTQVDANHPGVIEFNTGTATTGLSQASAVPVGNVVFGSGQVFEQHWLLYIPTLSDGTNTYAWRCGYLDSLGTPTQGVYFEYASGTSTNWRAVAMASSSPTAASGGGTVAVSAAAWTHLKWTWDGTTFTFYVNGTSIGTIATGIPTAAVGLLAGILKSAGGTARTVLLDLYQEGRRWSTARAT